MTSEIGASLTASNARSEARAWTYTAAALFAAYAIVVATYSKTASSAVYLWVHHNTYGYAFAVPPIIAFLLWRERSYFSTASPRAAPASALLCIPFAALWLAGANFSILELQHLALAGMIVSLAVTAIGLRSAGHFWLPLAYVFLLAPAGTPLLPYLQDITTFLAIAFLRIGQIAFFAEGHSIEVATGNYLVAPGCAGLNFILAMATVAPLFTVLMYNSWTKRLIALALLMAVVPIANGFRVFAIIAIAEYTHRAIDIAADHLFYGWLFFSAVVLLLFWIGSQFADPLPSSQPALSAMSTNASGHRGVGHRGLIVSLLIATAICVVPTIYLASQ